MLRDGAGLLDPDQHGGSGQAAADGTGAGRDSQQEVRHGAAERPARPRSLGPMMDFSYDETGKGPPVQMHSLREFEQHLNDLKKENFSLKLRIYFLEEKIQQKFDQSGDGVHRANIELKVEVESLKKDLQEKQELLDRALSTAEVLSNQNEAELQRRLLERQDEVRHMQEMLEDKVQLLQKEAEAARSEARRMASLADAEAQRSLALQREMLEKMEEHGDSARVQTSPTDADRLIEDLVQQKQSLSLQVEELQVKVHDLSSSLENRERGAELIGEQHDQLSRYQSAAGQCVAELQQAQNQVRSLQVNIRESEARNQKLQEHLAAMELQLRSAQDEAQQQERLIQNLTDGVGSKETEVSDLSRALEEQNQALRSLREVADRSQLSGTKAAPGQGEVLALQGALFQAQLELQAAQRAQRRADRAQEDQNRALERLERDLQGALQHRRETERHNRELQLILQTVRSDLQAREDQLSEGEQERRREREERERSVAELRADLQLKEQLLQEYGEMLKEPKENRDSVLQKLRQRITERDRALERAVDEKFRSAEQRDAASRQLQLLLREKERDLERQRRVLANNEETIASLEALLRGKELQLQQLADAWTGVRRQQRDADERTSQILKERDGIIEQLQAALLARTQEAQDLLCSLLPQVQSAPGQVLEELKLRLQLKDRLFQEVMSDRTRQAREHQEQVQDLLRTISSRDQYIQDSAARLTEVLEEQTHRVQELQRQLGSGSQPDAAAALQQELRLALKREEQNQEETRSRAEQLDHLSRSLSLKEEIIRDLQRKMADPSDLPLVERLTLEVQELREVLVRQEAAQQPEFGELSGEDEDVKSEFTADYDDGGDEESSTRVRTPAAVAS
ncbi:myomegalin isoform X2 [Poecilia latipinna]|uniref:myomegalin isoform X2 n=1 Tax=Poecilia latipinna TaxID=48699 RepID=UPI00072DB61A|nr:PREDICTED: myomegalin-like isoform X2 [Poecilia latipinna]